MHKPYINILSHCLQVNSISGRHWRMNRKIIYALVQTIKLFLFSIFKHRIPIEKYLFQNYLVLNFSLPFNNLSIQTFWQIGLHKAVPLRTFSRGHSVNVSVQSFKKLLCSKLPQWDSSGSGLISVILASLNFRTRDVSLWSPLSDSLLPGPRCLGKDCREEAF